MANILIYSSNPQLIDRCRACLSPGHSIKAADTTAIANIADIVLLDSQLIDKTPDLLSKITNASTLCLILGQHWPEKRQIQALINGACGYLEQQELGSLLRKAVDSIQQGEIWIHRKLVPQLINQLTIDSEAQKNHAVDKLKLSSLSRREIDVATMIATGQNNKQIANHLKISERTVKAHLTSIFKKLNISDRLHLALLVKESQY